MTLPRLLFTPGDVAGVGPEIIVKAWADLCSYCQPIVIGSAEWLQRAVDLLGAPQQVQRIDALDQAMPDPDAIPCLNGTTVHLDGAQPAKVCAEAGQAAYDFLCTAIDLTLQRRANGIVTAPLHKEGLKAAGLSYPGHTEILAERCGITDYAMVLYVNGIAVAHVTLHMALHDIFEHITTEAIVEKAQLLDGLMSRILNRRPHIGIAALNPHASDGGLFGHEEETIIAPAVRMAKKNGLEVSGPWPSDTLFLRAQRKELDAIVAMYHDQGHIPLKLMGEWQAVNITAGLPILRTSVAHGTAYDIAWQGKASATSLLEATKVAASLCEP